MASAQKKAQIAQYLQKLSAKQGPKDQPLVAHTLENDAPATSFQEATWLLSELDAGAVQYNECITLAAPVDSDPQLLLRAFDLFMQHQFALRTGLEIRDGQLYQIVHEHVANPLTIRDFRTLPAEQQPHMALQALKHLADMPFQLDTPPLVRGFVAQMTDRCCLYLVLHHAIFDGFSLNYAILPQIAELYQRLVDGNDEPLPPLPVQLRDYGFWLRDYLESAAYQRDMAYWRSTLQGYTGFVELPFRRPLPDGKQHTSDICAGQLDSDLSARLIALAQTEGVSLFMLLLASFQVLIYRYTHLTDYNVGSSTAHRKFPELQGVLGGLINAVVLRTKLDGSLSFTEVMHRAEETVLGALEHDVTPIEQVIRTLGEQHAPNQNPLFNILFSMPPAPPRMPEGWSKSVGEVYSPAPKYDLFIACEQSPGGIDYALTFDTLLYSKNDIRGFVDHWKALLGSVLEDPQAPIAKLNWLTEQESTDVISTWNQTALAYPRTLRVQDILAEQVARQPDALALIEGSHRLTYRELDDLSNQLANKLRELGARDGMIAALWLPRSYWLVVALFGIIKAGMTYLPLDPELPADRLAYIVDDARAAFIISDEVRPVAHDVTAVWCLLDDLERYPTQAPESSITAEDDLYVLYTSGSTGKPKGVRIRHRNVMAFLTAMQDRLHLTEQDRVLAITTISFDIAELEMLLPLFVGSACVMASKDDKIDGGRIEQLVAAHAVTVVQATPVNWRIWLETGWRGQRPVVMLCGGEALGSDLARRLLPHASALWNVYGPTETTIWSTMVQITSPESITIGRPIANTTVYVLDEAGQPVPPGVQGELYIGGEGVAAGYLNRPELTTQRFLPDPFARKDGALFYRTGDLVRYQPDGQIVYVGRADFQVKVNGFRIELGEIESVIKRADGVRDAVVIVREDVPGDRRIVAYIIPEDVFDQSSLLTHAAAFLPSYMVPNHIVTLDAFPQTPNNKIDRKALPLPDMRVAQATHQESDKPANEIETQLLGIWTDVLKVSPVSMDADFFHSGGNSLLAVLLMRRVNEQFALKLPPSVLFTHATIAKLGEIVAAEARPIATPVAASRLLTRAIAVRESGSGTPIFFIHGDWTAGGFYARDLAEAIEADRPFYVLDIDSEQPLPASMEELAAWHITTMRTIQPKGPYTLSGFCIGGLLAYEIACQLRARGEDVHQVVLIESSFPAIGLRWIYRFQLLGRIFGPRRRQLEKMLWAVNVDSLFQHAALRLRALTGSLVGRFTRQEMNDPYEAYQLIQKAEVQNQQVVSQLDRLLQGVYMWLFAGYRPKRFDGEVTLLMARQESLVRRIDTRWQRLVGRFHYEEVPGTHVTCRTEHVDSLGIFLARSLQME